MRQKLGEGSKPGYDARVAAGLGRGPNLRKKATAAAWSNTWPAPGATLDLDFANDRGFVRGIGQGSSMQAVTFTRASNANWVDSAGVLRTGAGSFPGTANALGLNFLSNPQNLENAAWTLQNLASFGSGSVVDATTAPDGTNTADFVREDSASTYKRIYQNTTAIAVNNSTQTVSAYVKNNGENWIRFEIYEGNISNTLYYSVFDLVNGAIGVTGKFNSGNGSFVSSSISNVGDGWYKCSMTYTTSSNASSGVSHSFSVFLLRGVGNVAINSAYSNSIFTGNGTSGIFIWGAQLEVGSSATTYYPTNINVPRFDWASTAQVANKNLFSYTEDLTVSPWVVINGATKNSALNFTFTATNSRVYQSVIIAAGATGTLSARFSDADVGKKIRRGVFDSVNGWQLSSDITIPTGGVVSSTFTMTNASTFVGFQAASDLAASTSFTLVAGQSAQVELGSTATTYQAVAQPTTNTPLAANSTCNGLLIEESRANRLLWCRDASNAAWTKTNVTAAKDQTGIDGVASAASSLTASAGNGTCIQTITLASGSRTGSVYLKRITGTGNVQVTLDGSTWSTVDLSNGLWNRIVLSGTVTNPTVGIRLATNGDAVAMDYGQIEDGAFATSPILTTTASVTRSADAASVSGQNFIGFYDNQRGTISAIGVPGNIVSSGSSFINIRGVAGGVEGRVELRIQNANTVIIVTNAAGALVLNAGAGPFSANQQLKISCAIQAGDIAAYTNGSLTAATQNLYAMPNAQFLFIGSYSSGLNPLNGWIKRVTYQPKRISNNGLITMTGIET